MKKKFSRKAKVIGAGVCCAIVIGGIVSWFTFFGNQVSDADKVYVQSVKELMGDIDSSGVQNRYAGIVEAQDTFKINKNSDTKVAEVLVSVGDTIKKGQDIFTYDVEDLQTQLDTANLEIQKQNNIISDSNAEITQAQADMANVSANEKLEYNVTINTAKADAKAAEYEIIKQQRTVEDLTDKINNATVKSEVEGVVKSINNTDSDSSDDDSDYSYSSSSSDSAFMTVLSTGNYRVKTSVSEQSISTISEGQALLVRSRVDEDQIWTGTVSKIDYENGTSDTSSQDEYMYDDSSSSSNTSTQIPVYVSLDSSAGLIMGQHVFVELDDGMTEDKEGIWLFEGYLVMDQETSYVWVADENDKLEKREVVLGDYDEMMGEYEITSGLSEDDYIAFPREDFTEGMFTTTEYIPQTEDEVYYDETFDEESYDEELFDDSEIGDDSSYMIDEGTTEVTE